MANPTWPETLPPPLSGGSASYGPPNNILETSMDSGGPKVRRRTTVMEIPFSCSIRLTQAQVAILEEFYYTTLAQVLPFDWIDFRTGAPCTYRFTKEGYRVTDVPGLVDAWNATLSLMKKP